jgi:K+-sensing histidine kinase KdpD
MESRIPIHHHHPPKSAVRVRPLPWLWSVLGRWFKTNVSIPRWYPVFFQRSFLGYLLAVLAVSCAVLLDVLLMHSFPSFGLSSLVTLLAVVIIALSWGAGPCLVATLLGTVLLDWLIFPRLSHLSGDPVRVLDDLMVLVVGLTVTAFTSRRMRQRRQIEHAARLAEEARARAEGLAVSLAQEQAKADLEHKRLEAIFEAMADGVTVYDHAGRIQRLNAAALELHGWNDVSAARSLPMVERGSGFQLRASDGTPLAQEEWLVPRLLQGEVIGSAEAQDYLFTNLRERQLEISISGTPVRTAEGRIVGAVTVMRDVTERRRNERAVREANRQMDAFLGLVSHELKTPVTTITLGLQIARRRMLRLLQRDHEAAGESGASLEGVAEQLERTTSQVERLDRLVNDLLDVSRIQAGQLDIRRAPADLTTIVGEAVEEQRQLHPERRISLALPTSPFPAICVDAARIGQVVTNYLTNALKYSAPDHPVQVGVEMAGASVRVWVRDQGPGVPLAGQEQIWERFHRVPGVEVLSGPGVGLGLGLSICRMIVDYHQGQIGVHSTVGEGSTFWFTLPVARSSQ